MTPVTGMNFSLGSNEKFQPGFRDEKRPKIPGTSSGAKFEKQGKHGETQKFYVSLQVDGMLMMLKIQQAMQDDAMRAARIHPGNRAEVFI